MVIHFFVGGSLGAEAEADASFVVAIKRNMDGKLLFFIIQSMLQH